MPYLLGGARGRGEGGVSVGARLVYLSLSEFSLLSLVYQKLPRPDGPFGVGLGSLSYRIT
jgi:hypothetical protein